MAPATLPEPTISRRTLNLDDTLRGDVAKIASDNGTRALQVFNEKLHRDERIDMALVPIGDSLTVASERLAFAIGSQGLRVANKARAQ